MAQSTQSSIRDEIVTVIVLIPVVLVFVPGMEDVVKALTASTNYLNGIRTCFVTCLAGLGLKGVDKFQEIGMTRV